MGGDVVFIPGLFCIWSPIYLSVTDGLYAASCRGEDSHRNII
jgi:hypothetical protein